MGSVPDVAPELDELLITIVVDNATDTLSSIGPGLPQLPELAAIFESVAPSRQHDGHDCVATFDHLCVACHGFSAVATARRGSQTTTALFDVGPYGGVWLANAERLGVDLAAIDVLFLSHWHWITPVASPQSWPPWRPPGQPQVERRSSSTSIPTVPT